jgi:hypothetical protein
MEGKESVRLNIQSLSNTLTKIGMCSMCRSNTEILAFVGKTKNSVNRGPDMSIMNLPYGRSSSVQRAVQYCSFKIETIF